MDKKIETLAFGQVSYNRLRHLILDRKLGQDESLQVSTKDFDVLVLEFRETYGSSMPRDLKILGIRIEEAREVPNDSVRLISPVKEEAKEIEYPQIGRYKWVDYFKEKMGW